MPFEQCRTCNGRGTVQVQRQRVDKNGKTSTEWVTEDCKGCRGSGVIPK